MAKKEFNVDEIIEVIQSSKYPTPRNDLTFNADQLSDEAVDDLKRKYLELLLSRGQSFAPFGKKLRVFANSTIPTIRADVNRALPGALSGLTADVTETSVHLSWAAASNTSQYVVEINGEAYLTESLSISFEDLPSGTEYTFKVTPVNNSDAGEGQQIVVVTLIPLVFPAALTGLLVTDVTSDSLMLSWNAALNALGYEVKFGNTTDTTTNLQYVVSGLSGGETYIFNVTPFNDDGRGDGAIVEARTLLLPGAVNDLVSSSVTETSAVLTWSAASNAVTYEINYGGNTLTSDTTSIEIDSLEKGTTYSFEVVAVNTDGRGAGATVEVRTKLLPSTVTGLTVEARTETSIELTWAAASNAASYEISYGDETIPTADTNFEIGSLVKGTTYTFTVTAINDDGRGDGAIVEASTLLLPGAVNDLVSSSITETSAVLTWAAASNATSYKIDYSGNTLTSDTTSIEIGSLVKGTAYTFTVTATNDDGSGDSATVEVRTHLLPGVVNDLVSSSITETSAMLTWAAASNAVSYKISYNGTTLTSDTTSIEIDSLVKGTTYTFEVIAVNADGQGAGVPIEVRTKLLPAAVTGLTIEDRTETSIELSWNESANATSYVISYGGETITTSATSFDIVSLSKGTEYTFTVTATNVDGSGDSATTNAATLIIPAAVSDLLATPTDTTVFISWSGVEHATSYEVSYGSTTLFSDEPSINVTELTAETEYTFAITPIGTDGRGPSASIVTTTLPIEGEEDPIGEEEEGTGDE